MKFRLVSENEFLKSILSELDERFKESKKTRSEKENFEQAAISLDFKIGGKLGGKKCCVCYRQHGGGIICTGDCCADVFEGD